MVGQVSNWKLKKLENIFEHSNVNNVINGPLCFVLVSMYRYSYFLDFLDLGVGEVYRIQTV